MVRAHTVLVVQHGIADPRYGRSRRCRGFRERARGTWLRRRTPTAEASRVTDIRTAIPEDSVAVARVHIRSWQVAYRGLIAQAYLDCLKPGVWAAKYVFQRTGPDRPITLLAVDGDSIRGLAM